MKQNADKSLYNQDKNSPSRNTWVYPRPIWLELFTFA